MRNRFVPVAAAVMAAALLTACGGSPTAKTTETSDAAAKAKSAAQAVYDKINGLSGEERTKTLKELAEKEGKLSIYTSNTDLDKLIESFQKKYKVTVEVYRGNSESVLQRILQESKANYFGNDFTETNAGELNILSKEGYFADYKGALRDSVRKEGQANGWTATRFNVFVIGWNTTKVKPGEEPKSFEDLADPKWKGMVSMEVGDVDWFAAMYQYYLKQGKTDAQIKELFTKVAANSKVAKGHTAQGELLTAGQFAITVSSYSHTIDKAVKAGAPVAWHTAAGTTLQPVVLRPNGMGLMKTAAHPAAAMLFADFELTEGQKILGESFRLSALAGKNDPLAGLTTVSVPEEEILNNGKKWDDLYAEILRAGQAIK